MISLLISLNEIPSGEEEEEDHPVDPVEDENGKHKEQEEIIDIGRRESNETDGEKKSLIQKK